MPVPKTSQKGIARFCPCQKAPCPGTPVPKKYARYASLVTDADQEHLMHHNDHFETIQTLTKVYCCHQAADDFKVPAATQTMTKRDNLPTCSITVTDL